MTKQKETVLKLVPKKKHHVVYVIINKRSFESFMCLDQTSKPELYLKHFTTFLQLFALHRKHFSWQLKINVPI